MRFVRLVSVLLLLCFTRCFTAPAATAADAPTDCSAHSGVAPRLACRIVARSALMPAVAAYKAANDLPIYDAGRETAVLERAARDTRSGLLFVQLQMDLAKQVQAAWMNSAIARSKSAPPAPTELARLRVRLDAMADAIAADLQALRRAEPCDRSGLEKALVAGLAGPAGLETALDENVVRYYARMLATAACCVEPFE